MHNSGCERGRVGGRGKGEKKKKRVVQDFE
jgi:hypothetical protein